MLTFGERYRLGLAGSSKSQPEFVYRREVGGVQHRGALLLKSSRKFLEILRDFQRFFRLEFLIKKGLIC